MKKIAILVPDITASSIEKRNKRVTPNQNGIWKDTKFIVNPRIGEFDGIIVLQSVRPLDRSYSLKCPKSKLLLVLQEPPDILFLPESYTRQFYCSLSQDKRIKSKVRILSHSGHHWFIDINITDALENTSFSKSKLLSTIVSNKTDTSGHRKRLEFIRAIKDYFGSQLDWYGRGINEIKNGKISGLADYKYHIVLENGSWPHYWTEKLADAFMANCFPFYWGAPNIFDYFSHSSLKQIDLDDIKGTIHTIEASLEQNLYEASQNALWGARNKILTEYHPCETFLNTLNSLPNSKSKLITIKPHISFQYDFSTQWRVRVEKYLNLLQK